MNTSYEIGELAEKYETGSRGVGFISKGSSWGDPGGISYGSYQLAINPGTLAGFLRTEYGKANFAGLRPTSVAFDKRWKYQAAIDPEGFKQAQFDYVCTISYNKCRRYADSIGYPDNLAINSALFSISNQHGGWIKILQMAKVDVINDSLEKIINKLYDARSIYVQNLTTLSSKLKINIVKQRCILERRDCLALI